MQLADWCVYKNKLVVQSPLEQEKLSSNFSRLRATQEL